MVAPYPPVLQRPPLRFTVMLGLVLLASGCASFEPVTTEALSTLVSTASPSASDVLVATAPGERFINHPTLLPEGWELCRHLERAQTGDRWCHPDDEDVWLQVATRQRDLVRLDLGEPIEGSATGVWLARTEPIEAAFPSSAGDVVVVSSAALPEDSLVTIAESIPLVGSRDSLYAEYELPLDLETVSDEELAKLLESLGEEVRVNRRNLEASIFTSVIILRVFAVDELYVPDLAPWIPKPRLIDGDRPVVVGESESRSRSYAIWDQRGYGWRLEGQMTAQDASGLALAIVELVAALP